MSGSSDSDSSDSDPLFIIKTPSEGSVSDGDGEEIGDALPIHRVIPIFGEGNVPIGEVQIDWETYDYYSFAIAVKFANPGYDETSRMALDHVHVAWPWEGFSVEYWSPVDRLNPMTLPWDNFAAMIDHITVEREIVFGTTVPLHFEGLNGQTKIIQLKMKHASNPAMLMTMIHHAFVAWWKFQPYGKRIEITHASPTWVVSLECDILFLDTNGDEMENIWELQADDDDQLQEDEDVQLKEEEELQEDEDADTQLYDQYVQNLGRVLIRHVR